MEWSVIDGLTAGLYALVKFGNAPIASGNAQTIAWWWSVVLVHEERILGIRQRASYDIDKMCAPKNLWVLSKEEELEKWYERRDEMRKQPKPLR